MSLKVSIDKDYKSNGYGFIRFTSTEMAKAAIEQHMANLGIEIDVNPYEPRDSTKKAVSNIFVKNFPVSWDDAKLRETFSPFGNILSIFRQTDEKIGLPFAFICYGQADSQDVNYGISCATKAQ